MASMTSSHVVRLVTPLIHLVVVSSRMTGTSAVRSSVTECMDRDKVVRNVLVGATIALCE